MTTTHRQSPTTGLRINMLPKSVHRTFRARRHSPRSERETGFARILGGGTARRSGRCKQITSPPSRNRLPISVRGGIGWADHLTISARPNGNGGPGAAVVSKNATVGLGTLPPRQAETEETNREQAQRRGFGGRSDNRATYTEQSRTQRVSRCVLAEIGGVRVN